LITFSSIDRHTYAINMVFADGSPQSVTLSDLKKIPWYRGWIASNFNPALSKK